MLTSLRNTVLSLQIYTTKGRRTAWNIKKKYKKEWKRDKGREIGENSVDMKQIPSNSIRKGNYRWKYTNYFLFLEICVNSLYIQAIQTLLPVSDVLYMYTFFLHFKVISKDNYLTTLDNYRLRSPHILPCHVTSPVKE